MTVTAHVMHATVTHPPLEKDIGSSAKERHIGSSAKFSQKEVHFSDTPLFFPRGLEKLFLAIYFISLPYLAGLLFLFFYISERKVKLFFSLFDQSSFILTWAIGYEAIAALIMLYIVKMGLTFAYGSQKQKRKQFRRP
jgi:hypothetical protein